MHKTLWGILAFSFIAGTCRGVLFWLRVMEEKRKKEEQDARASDDEEAPRV